MQCVMMKTLPTLLHQNTGRTGRTLTRREREWERFKQFQLCPKTTKSIHELANPSEALQTYRCHEPLKYIKNGNRSVLWKCTHEDNNTILHIDDQCSFVFDCISMIRTNHNILSWARRNDTNVYVYQDGVHTFDIENQIVDLDVVYDSIKNVFVIVIVNDKQEVCLYHNDICVKKHVYKVDIFLVYLISFTDFMIVYNDSIRSEYCIDAFLFSTNNQSIHARYDPYSSDSNKKFLYSRSEILDLLYLPHIHHFLIKTYDIIYIVDSNGMTLFSNQGLKALRAAITNEELTNNMIYYCDRCNGFTFNKTEEVMFYINHSNIYAAQTIYPYDIKLIYKLDKDNTMNAYSIIYNNQNQNINVYKNGHHVLTLC